MRSLQQVLDQIADVQERKAAHAFNDDGNHEAGVRDALMDAAATVDPAEDPTGAGFGVVYWSPVKGHTVDSPVGKIVAKAAYRQTTTTRNLRTLAKIVG